MSERIEPFDDEEEFEGDLFNDEDSDDSYKPKPREFFDNLGIDPDSPLSPEAQIRNRINEIITEPAQMGFSNFKVDQLKLLFNFDGMTSAEKQDFLMPHIIDLHLKGFHESEMSIAFDIAIKDIKQLIEDSKLAIRQRIKDFDATEKAGELMSFRDTIIKECMKLATSTGDDELRLKALKMGLKASDSQFSIVNNLNLFEGLKEELNKTEDKTSKDRDKVSAQIDNILNIIETKVSHNTKKQIEGKKKKRNESKSD